MQSRHMAKLQGSHKKKNIGCYVSYIVLRIDLSETCGR